MAAGYESIDRRRKTFYLCDCPPRPLGRTDGDLIDWYMHHINTCKPRRIVDLKLPEYEGAE